MEKHLKMLKVLGDVAIYSSSSTWEVYKSLVTPVRERILSGNFEVTDVRYGNTFNESYRKYTEEKNWGSNLDVYTLTVDSDLFCSLRYDRDRRVGVDRYEFEHVFTVYFMMPSGFLLENQSLRAGIERKFKNHCRRLQEEAEEARREAEVRGISIALLSQIK